MAWTGLGLIPGVSFDLSVSVRNNGSGSSAATTLRYYQSTVRRQLLVRLDGRHGLTVPPHHLIRYADRVPWLGYRIAFATATGLNDPGMDSQNLLQNLPKGDERNYCVKQGMILDECPGF